MDKQRKPKWARGVAWAVLIYGVLGAVGSMFVSTDTGNTAPPGKEKYIILVMGLLLAAASGYYLFLWKPTDKPSLLSNLVSFGPPEELAASSNPLEPTTLQKPNCLTPVIAWAVGGVFLLREFAQQRALSTTPIAQRDDSYGMLLAGVCFLAGLVVWGLDWWKYKKGIP